MWRKTPQTLLIKSLLKAKGHATNQELAAEARKTYPNMTNTTVHRITDRLVDSGMAAYAPSLRNVKIIDAKTESHDHFYCQTCHRLLDIKLSDMSFNAIQSQLPGKLSRSNILIAGTCQRCL